ncbi:low molecular weight protein-tyrosine-phosphatase [Aurantivibrio plasticivorans]
MVKVLFVCLGNICRSPTAHGVFRHKVQQANLQHRIAVDSAGTGDWHVGHEPDGRAIAAASRRSYDLTDLRARQVIREDFDSYDYVLAMDNSNLSHLCQLRPSHYSGHLSLFLDFSEGQSHREVPDPYYGGEQGFELVLDLIENASDNLIRHIQKNHQ